MSSPGAAAHWQSGCTTHPARAPLRHEPPNRDGLFLPFRGVVAPLPMASAAFVVAATVLAVVSLTKLAVLLACRRQEGRCDELSRGGSRAACLTCKTALGCLAARLMTQDESAIVVSQLLFSRGGLLARASVTADAGAPRPGQPSPWLWLRRPPRPPSPCRRPRSPWPRPRRRPQSPCRHSRWPSPSVARSPRRRIPWRGTPAAAVEESRQGRWRRGESAERSPHQVKARGWRAQRTQQRACWMFESDGQACAPLPARSKGRNRQKRISQSLHHWMN